MPYKPPQGPHAGPTGLVCSFGGVVPLPGLQNRTQGHTGACLVSPSFPGALLLRQSCQLAFQVVIHRLVNGQNRVKQRPVSRGPVQCPYGSGQGFDEAFVLQLRNILPHCVRTHAGVFPNFAKARVTQVRLPVLTKQQIDVHSNLPGAQSQREDLVGQKKITAQWAAVGVSVPDFRGVPSPMIFQDSTPMLWPISIAFSDFSACSQVYSCKRTANPILKSPILCLLLCKF